MPGLISKSALRSGGSNTYIKLENAQPQLPPTPTTSTGYTVVTDSKLVTTYRSSLGNLEMNSGTVYSNLPDGTIRLVGTGTGTVLVLGGASSTSTNTGALQVIGGISSTKDIFVNGLTIGQGYEGVNNIVLRGVALPVGLDANDGQQSIAIGYDVLEGISSSRNTIAIGRGALSSGTELIGQLAIGDKALHSLGNLTVWPVGAITGISQASPAVVTLVNHGLSTGTVVQITGLLSGPTDLNNEDYWVNVLSLDTLALYTDNILNASLDTTGLPAYTTGGNLSRVLFYDENTALGANAGMELVDGRQNLFLGPLAGQFLTTGSYNVFIGHEASNNMITGNENISINGGRLVDGLDNQISIGSVLYYDGLTDLYITSEATIGTGTQSAGTDTGALVVDGGVGISKDLYVGGKIYGSIDASSLSELSELGILANTATNAMNVLINNSVSATTYYVALTEQKDGNYSPLDADTNVYYNTENQTLTSTKFSTLGETNSTSTNTGDIIVSGGIGVGKDLYIGGKIFVISTAASTSTTTGALQVTGGISTQDHIYSLDGGEKENRLLYTPRVLVGTSTVVTSITPRVGDFWIDTAENAQYQYIDDSGQRFWLQIAII
jgi:hypothetical protein